MPQAACNRRGAAWSATGQPPHHEEQIGMSNPTVTIHPAPHRHHGRSARAAAAIVAVAGLIAAGGYAATTTFGPDAHDPRPGPAVSEYPIPSDRVLRELHESVEGQYGSRPRTAATVRPGRRAQRELRDATAELYGPAR
jgi:hypothetical protein